MTPERTENSSDFSQAPKTSAGERMVFNGSFYTADNHIFYGRSIIEGPQAPGEQRHIEDVKPPVAPKAPANPQI